MQTITTRLRNMDGSSVKVVIERHPDTKFPYDATLIATDANGKFLCESDVRTCAEKFPFAAVMREAGIREYELKFGHTYASWTSL